MSLLTKIVSDLMTICDMSRRQPPKTQVVPLAQRLARILM